MRKFKISMQKALIFILTLAIIPAYSLSVFATSGNESEEDLTPIVLSTDAAANGVYRYNLQTQEETYIPTEMYARSSGSNTSPQFLPASAGSEPMKPKTVTDPDDRFKVENVTGRYSNTVLLKIKFPNRAETFATGWVIGPNHIATAGHCVFNYDYGWAEYITVYPGASGGTHPFGSAQSTNLYAGGDYVANQGNYNRGINDDWGVIEVNSPIGNSTGWLGLQTASNFNDVRDYSFQTNGYPSDLDNNGISINNKWMYSTYGTFTGERPLPLNNISPYFLPTMYMDIDFAGGQSGSAIYRYISDLGYTAQAIGVGGNGQTIVVLINNWLFDFFISLR